MGFCTNDFTPPFYIALFTFFNGSYDIDFDYCRLCLFVSPVTPLCSDDFGTKLDKPGN